MQRFAVLSLLCLGAMPARATPADDAMAHAKAFERAVNARDAGAVVALYASDARVVWPGQGDEAKGRAEIEKLVARFVKELPADAKMTLVSQSAIPLADGYVATVGHWTETFTDPDGKRQTADIRTSEIIRQEKGRTLYVVDHASIGLPPPPEPASAPGARQ